MKIKVLDIIKYLFLIIVVIISSLPSGVFLGINIKIILFLLLIIILTYTLTTYNTLLPFKLTSYLITSILIIILYTIYGFINYGIIALQESKLIIITILLTYIYYIFINKVFTRKIFFQLYSNSILLIFIIKVIAYLYSFVTDGSLNSSVDFYSEVFDAKIISMQLPYNLFRLYVQTDILAAFLPFVLIWAIKNKIIKNSNIIFLIGLFVAITSFSRFIMAIFFIGSIIYFYVLGKLKQMFIVVIPIIAIIAVMYYEEILEFIELRFFSTANSKSDSIRDIQSVVLWELFLEKPIFGHGIGAYSHNMIRSVGAPFSYEKQILSFFPKIGIIGMSIVAIIFTHISFRFVRKKNFVGLLVFLLFFISGWFNPYLYSSNIILLYVFIMILLDDGNKQILSTKQ